MPGRKLLPLVLLVLAASALMTYQAREGAIRNPAAPVNSAFYGVSAGLGDFLSGTRDLLRHFGAKDERIRELERELSLLRKNYDQVQEIWKENGRLKALLALKDSTPQFVAAANVVTRGAKRWANTFTLDAGGSKGVEKEMIVVAPSGLAGKIIQVEGSYSKALLINDVRFSVAVRVQETRTEAILSGTGTGFCRLKYFPHETRIKNGYTLISSGLDGVFPEGLRVGFVSRVSKGEGLFQEVEVMPFVETDRLEEVAIIRR